MERCGSTNGTLLCRVKAARLVHQRSNVLDSLAHSQQQQQQQQKRKQQDESEGEQQDSDGEEDVSMGGESNSESVHKLLDGLLCLPTEDPIEGSFQIVFLSFRFASCSLYLLSPSFALSLCILSLVSQTLLTLLLLFLPGLQLGIRWFLENFTEISFEEMTRDPVAAPHWTLTCTFTKRYVEKFQL